MEVGSKHQDEPKAEKRVQAYVEQKPASNKIQANKTSPRSTTVVFGLGNSICEDDANICGSQLPTSHQVLRCLMWHISEGSSENRTRWDSAKMVLQKVTQFYDKANIPMISTRKACEKMLALLDENAKLRAIPVSRRSAPSTEKKMQDMHEKLERTFVLWPQNAELIMKNREDILFLESMKTDRAASFGLFERCLSE